MSRRFAILLAGILLHGAAQAEETIDWRPWSEDVFEHAREENRFVLLDLGAVWCHWCHVMEDVTYRDPEVIRLIRSRYIAVRVDQDSRPDLSNRYEDYGWPATIVFNADGSEIVKRQGYIPPRPMASMLQAIIDDPTPGPSVLPEEKVIPADTASLSPEIATALRKRLLDAYDPKNLGWGTIHKFLDWNVVEYCIFGTAQDADRDDWQRMARETLSAQRNLFDPVWGGVYQYSTDGDWKHPHYEKLLQFQAENLRIYSVAFARWGDPEYLKDAKQIRGYIKEFLTSSEGAFYTSQDADLVPGQHSEEYFALDDQARREKGIPRVDTHIYSRENGWAIQALATLYAVTGESEHLNDATRAANWIIARRALPGGGFSHEKDTAGPYLGDTLFMGNALLALYSVTAERSWLDRARAAANFINEHFKSDSGFSTSIPPGTLRPARQLDENVALARFANLLSHYTGDLAFREMAEHAMRHLAAEGAAQRRGYQVGGILLADRELSVPPLHITVVGSKGDPTARALFLAALKQPATYKRVEWFDESEGPLPNPDVEYPRIGKAAAFFCTERACSTPIFTPDKFKVR